MNTLQRINNLLLCCYLPPVSAKDLQLTTYRVKLTPADPIYRYTSWTPVHDIIDRIDRHTGIITRFRPCSEELTPVGERLRRLERHHRSQEAPPFFWLGAQASQSAHTG